MEREKERTNWWAWGGLEIHGWYDAGPEWAIRGLGGMLVFTYLYGGLIEEVVHQAGVGCQCRWEEKRCLEEKGKKKVKR